MTTEALPRGGGWRRFVLVHALQLPVAALVILVAPGWSWVAGCVWASLVSAVGTDSGWRWRNRILVVETILWLTLALCLIP